MAGLRTVKIYAPVAALAVSLSVGLLALATESASPRCSPQDRAAGRGPVRPAAPSPTGPTGGHAIKTDAPGTRPAPKIPDPPAPSEQPRREENAAPSGRKQEASPALDLASLKKRLRETEALGFFTKLLLKNQVDDLVEQFRAFHRGRGGPRLAELRERYDLLLLKVLSLLQDSDPPLACDISASREALWSLLADPAKFTACDLKRGKPL
jgi:hypothetical protein